MFDPISMRRLADTSRNPSDKGKPGKDALEVILRTDAGFIQWGYKGFSKWHNLIAIKDLEGAPGSKGLKGDTGASGINGNQGSKGDRGETGPRGLIGEKGMSGLDGLDGANGKDGREIELRVYGGYIQWRYVGDALWKNLILLSELKGDPGKDGEKGKQGERGPKGSNGSVGETGPRGPMGYPGASGSKGDPGVGVPVGGTTGQVLAKDSNSDYDTEWVDQTGGGGDGTIPQYDSDPVSPNQHDVWVRRSTSGVGGGKLLFIAGLMTPVTSVGAITNTYELSYRTEQATTKRVTLA